MKNGRMDLSGLCIPETTVAETLRTPIANISRLGGVVVAKQINWTSLDFTGSRLKGLRFHDCTINDCVFDRCNCQDWRLWSTQVQDTRFHSTDLRKSALGGLEENRQNSFRRVHFDAADLRQTAYTSARFSECVFSNSRLDKVNFQGSEFVDCSFEGEIREVCFNRLGFGAETLHPNSMVRVDFLRAHLRSVEFRNLDLKEVHFPSDQDHIPINDYTRTLDRLIRQLQDQKSSASKKLAAYLGVYRRWAGLNQERGILNKNDVLEIGGKEGLQTVLSMVESERQ
jgi:uncharacterized protein YjbI with pentapeptide repeats